MGLHLYVVLIKYWHLEVQKFKIVKAYWGYTEDFLQQCKGDLTVAKECIKKIQEHHS